MTKERTTMVWLLALAAGAMLPIQAGVNARLGRELHNPVLATLVSFVVGCIALMLYCLLARTALPAAGEVTRVPVWAWFGGLLGAVYLTAVIFLIPRLGVGVSMGLVITGQILVSVLLDHFGLLGLVQHPIGVGRIVGVILMTAGIILIKRY